MKPLRELHFSYAFVIVAACFLLQAVGLGLFIGFGVFINPLIAEFGWPRATLSGASSTALFLSGVISILIGRVTDKTGPRLVVMVCAVFFGLGHVLMSRLNSVWQLYLFFGVIAGIGLGCVDVIALSTTAQWFLKKRGAMTGIVKVGAGFGHLLIPMGASILIIRQGWRASYIAIGIGAFIAFLIISLLVKAAPKVSSSPPSQHPPAATGGLNVIEANFSFRDAVRTKNFWLIGFANLLALYCLMTIMVHIVPHASQMVDSPTKAAGVISVIGFTSMGGRFIAGLVIDRIGSKLTAILYYILLFLTLLWLQIADAPWMLYFFAAFYGIAHGGIFTIISPIVADYFGIKSHGSLFGIAVFLGTTGGSIGPFVSGFIFDATGAYNLAFWICSGAVALGLFLITLLKPAGNS